MPHLRTHPLFSLFVMLTALPAQTNWAERLTTTRPPAREGHAMAFDSTRGRLVVFGGTDGYTTSSYSDTWEWDGARWTIAIPANRPSPRSNHTMAYDSARGRVVLFGGASFTGGALGDTWEWDGTNWLQRTPVTSPPSRFNAAMVYDSIRGRVVLFGGGPSALSGLADTWEWDGTNWTQRTPTTSPPRRSQCGMAFDSKRGRTVLYSGISFPTGNLNDTWEWDGNNWVNRAPPPSHDGDSMNMLCYDSARGRVVMFAGRDNTLWEWDGNIWTRRTTATNPPGRSLHAVAYDSVRHGVVMFGGETSGKTIWLVVADTWYYAPIDAASCNPFGTGCQGSAGTPSLGPEPGSLPWIGDAFVLRVTNLGTSPGVLLTVGDSRTQWGAMSLPLSLGSFGMPGCTLYTSTLATFQLSNVAGTATWTLAIPNSLSLIGQPFYTQAAVASAGANSLGVVVTNACEIKLGAR